MLAILRRFFPRLTKEKNIFEKKAFFFRADVFFCSFTFFLKGNA